MLHFISRKRKFDSAVFVFAAIVALFGASRIRSDYRWGGWAVGDAQNLNGSTHFAEEGFTKHYFLPYYHPGYLGERFGTETELGYYTHYPPLSTIINGLIIKYWGEELWKCRFVSILFSVFWLILLYYLLTQFLERPAALTSTILVGTSAAYLDYMDGLSPYTYSEFFVFGSLLTYVRSKVGDHEKNWSLFALAWILFLLESVNSFDYILFVFFFVAGYHLVMKKDFKRNYVFVLLFGLAPVCGFLLHLLQNAWMMGSFIAVYRDIFGISTARLAQPLSMTGLAQDIHRLAINMAVWLRFNFGLRWHHAILIFGLAVYLRKRMRPADIPHPYFPLFFILTISTLEWWLLGMQAAGHFAQQMVRQIFPAVTILYAFTYISTIRIWKEGVLHFLEKCIITCATIWLTIPLLLSTHGYLRDYPNWIQPFRCWAITDSQPVLIQGIDMSKQIKRHTNFGDIVFVPEEFIWLDWNKEPSPIYEYFSQRRLEYVGDDRQDFLERFRKVEEYITVGLPSILGRSSKVERFAVLPLKTTNPFYQQLLKSSAQKTEISPDWTLIPL